jgi:hypothetical protein
LLHCCAAGSAVEPVLDEAASRQWLELAIPLMPFWLEPHRKPAGRGVAPYPTRGYPPLDPDQGVPWTVIASTALRAVNALAHDRLTIARVKPFRQQRS